MVRGVRPPTGGRTRRQDQLERIADVLDAIGDALGTRRGNGEGPPQFDPAQDARTEAELAPNLTDDPHCATYPRCVARDRGESDIVFYALNGAVVDPAAQQGYVYQHFVCPWHMYVPNDPTSAQFIEDWVFDGVRFHGLDRNDCHLYETVYGYDAFLARDELGRTAPLRGWMNDVFARLVAHARRQHAVVAPHWPDLRLTWVFSDPTVMLYMYRFFAAERLIPVIELDVRPFVTRGYGDTD